MNIKSRGVVFLQIIALSLFFFLISGCKYFKKEEKQTQQQVAPEVIHDTLLLAQDTAYIEIPVPYEVVRDSFIYVSNPVDTLEILKMFAEKKVFLDTIKLEFGYITILDTISGGSIVSRKFTPKIKVPYKERIQTVKEEPKANLYLGINGGFDRPNYMYSLGTSLLYQTPNKRIYEVGIGVWNRTEDGIYGQFVPYFKGGAYWPIELKSKKK